MTRLIRSIWPFHRNLYPVTVTFWQNGHLVPGHTYYVRES